MRGHGGFGHTWSLAIEEQFYLFWPLVVALSAGRRRVLVAVCTALCLVGFGSLVADGGRVPPDRTAAYFLPHTRGWEILAGCLLALVLPRVAVPARLASAALWAAVPAGIALVVVAARPATPLWLATLLAAVLAVVVVGGVVRAPDAVVSRFLAGGRLVRLGEISYGVYLYPGVVVRVVGPELPAAARVVVLPLTLLVAAASFRWVERPVQVVVRRALAGRRAGAAALVAGRA